jgi:hypothetical protein
MACRGGAQVIGPVLRVLGRGAWFGAEDEDACLAGGVDEERRRWNLSGAEAHMIFSFSGSGAGDKESFVWIKLECPFRFLLLPM